MGRLRLDWTSIYSYMNLCYATIQEDMVESKIAGKAVLPWELRSSWNILPGDTCGAVRPEGWIILSKSRTRVQDLTLCRQSARFSLDRKVVS